MALTNAYLVTTKNLDAFVKSIQSAKAPDRFTNKFLSQLDFSSSNDRLLIGVLKALRFIDDNGVPTQRYFDFLDQGQSGRVLAEGIRDAYSDLFNVNKNAQNMTIDEVKNKLKTLTLGQKSDNVVSLMANTFKALSDLADWQTPPPAVPAHAAPSPAAAGDKPEDKKKTPRTRHHQPLLCRRTLRRPIVRSSCITTSRFTCPSPATLPFTTRSSLLFASTFRELEH